MLKRIPLILGVLCSTWAMGQSLTPLKNTDFQIKNPSVQGLKQLDGTITTEHRYVPGTTTNVVFTLNLNLDNDILELGDSLSLTFPEGVTVIATTNNPEFEPVPAGLTPELLNGIDGQVVSWGNNDNQDGGIIGQGTEIEMNLTFSDTLTQDLKVALFISSDQGTFEPHGNPGDLVDTVIIPLLPSIPDLDANNFSTNLYTQVPEHLVGSDFDFTGITQNRGAELTDEVYYVFSLNGVSDSSLIRTPFESFGTDTLYGSVSTMLTPGNHFASHNAKYGADSDLSDNVHTFSVYVGDTILARDNGNFIASFPIGSQIDVGAGPSQTNAISVFEIAEGDTMTAVQVYFESQMGGDDVYVTVHEFDGTDVGAEIAQSLVHTTQATTDGEWITLEFPNGFALVDTQFAIQVVGQSVANGQVGTVGISEANYLANTQFIALPAFGLNAEIGQTGNYGAFGIRGVFANYTGTLDPDMEMISMDFNSPYPVQPRLMWEGSAPLDLTVQATNSGLSANTGGTMTMFIMDGNGTGVYSNVYDLPTINPGETFEYTYSASIDFNSLGADEYTLAAIFNGTGDVNLDNDSLFLFISASDSLLGRADNSFLGAAAVGQELDLGAGPSETTYGVLFNLGMLEDTLTGTSMVSIDLVPGDSIYTRVLGVDVTYMPDASNILMEGKVAVADLPAGPFYSIPLDNFVVVSGYFYVEVGVITPDGSSRNLVYTSRKYELNTSLIKTGDQYYDLTALTTVPAANYVIAEFGTPQTTGVAEMNAVAFTLNQNPVEDVLRISSDDSGSFTLMNMAGQKVLAGKLNANVDVSNLPEGTYIALIEAKNAQSAIQVVK